MTDWRYSRYQKRRIKRTIEVLEQILMDGRRLTRAERRDLSHMADNRNDDTGHAYRSAVRRLLQRLQH